MASFYRVTYRYWHAWENDQALVLKVAIDIYYLMRNALLPFAWPINTVPNLKLWMKLFFTINKMGMALVLGLLLMVIAYFFVVVVLFLLKIP